MAIYRDKNGNKRDVYLVEGMKKRKQDYKDVLEHNAPQRTHWNEFVKLATAHLPKDVAFHYTNGDLTRCRLYLPDDFMEMGELMMEELKNPDGTVHERLYHVTSHTIVNRRYCPWNSPWEYRTRSTKSLDKAVKNARTALRPNSLADVARVSIEKIKECVNDVRSRARTDFWQATRNLGFEGFHVDESLPPLLDDIVRQTDMGLVRLSDKCNDLLARFHKARDRNKHVDKTEYARLCWVHTNHVGDQVVDTHRVRVGSGQLEADKGKGMDTYDRNLCVPNKETYCNNVPEDVQHKVSVLSMLDNYEYVEEVGYKYSDSVYYIFDEQ